MLIAQLTDIHVGFSPEEGDGELNLLRLRAVIDRLLSQPNQIDMLVLSGDLTDKGDEDSFDRLVQTLSPCPFPVFPMVGNHDLREQLLSAFPQCPSEGGFVHYSLERDGLYILCLDTLEVGRHGGAFCSERADWLQAQLAGHRDTPTVIFMHHPPIVSGIDWMDPSPGEDWIENFGSAIEGHDQIVAIRCGHLHRPLTTDFLSVPTSVIPPVAPYVAMDLRPTDHSQDAQRALITTEPPAYALHHWDGSRFTTHHETVGDWDVIAYYDELADQMMAGAKNEC